MVPSGANSSSVEAMAPSLMSQIITQAAFFSRQRRAIILPIPEQPPVISTVFPVIFIELGLIRCKDTVLKHKKKVIFTAPPGAFRVARNSLCISVFLKSSVTFGHT